MMKIISCDKKTITVQFEMEDVEFILDELPRNDGFTNDWLEHVVQRLRDAQPNTIKELDL